MKLLTGEVVAEEINRQERWLEHFCGVFNGKLFKDVSALPSPAVSPFSLSSAGVDWSAQYLLRTLRKMNPTKGLGPDQLPLNLWSAGGIAAAKHLETLGGRIAASGLWPAPLRGSRIVDLWKSKGDRLV